MKKILLLLTLISFSAISQNNPALFRNGVETKLIGLDTLTTVQRDALTLKASKGYVIFNADTNVLNLYDGTSWGDIGATPDLSAYQLKPSEGAFVDGDKTKLDGIEAGATVNSPDNTLLNRANHTGTQTASTISDFDTEINNNTDVAANTAARHDAVSVLDSGKINLGLTGQQVTADIIAGTLELTDLTPALQTTIAKIDVNEADIAALQASTISTIPRNVTSTAGVFTEAYNESQPNVRLNVTEDTNISITGMNAGDALIFSAEETAGTERLLQFIGTNDTLRAHLKDELAYFIAIKDTVLGTQWQRSYKDGKTDKVRSITGTGQTTINWEDSPYWDFTHGAMNDTLIFINPESSKPLKLKRRQDTTGSRTLAYASDIDVAGGTLPTLSTGANDVDVIHMFYDKENDIYEIKDVELNLQTVAGTPPLIEHDVTGKTYNSSGHGANPPSNSFDGDINTFSSTLASAGGWISIDFGTAVTVQQIQLKPKNSATDGLRANGVQLRWSNDGSTWTNIGTVVSGVDAGNYTNWIIKNFSPQSARYWGWINTTTATYSGNIAEAKFYGY